MNLYNVCYGYSPSCFFSFYNFCFYMMMTHVFVFCGFANSYTFFLKTLHVLIYQKASFLIKLKI